MSERPEPIEIEFAEPMTLPPKEPYWRVVDGKLCLFIPREVRDANGHEMPTIDFESEGE